MTRVHLLHIKALENPSPVNKRLDFDITLECSELLQQDLEWRLVYVGASDSLENPFDQELEHLLLGPIGRGRMHFVLSAKPPDLSLLPLEHRMGAAVLLLTCKYKEQEFLRVGYFVNTECLQDSSIVRDILMEAPRMTHSIINWD